MNVVDRVHDLIKALLYSAVLEEWKGRAKVCEEFATAVVACLVTVKVRRHTHTHTYIHTYIHTQTKIKKKKKKQQILNNRQGHKIKSHHLTFMETRHTYDTKSTNNYDFIRSRV